MDIQELLAPDAGLPLGPSRARVLNMLRAAGSPLAVRDVADQTGLHPSTARFHLDGLVEAGLATRQSQPRQTPGRPSMTYRAADDGDPAGDRRYRLLAEMLASLIDGMMPHPRTAALAAGREWGAYLTQQPPPYRRPGAEDAVERLASIMTMLGFAPQTEAEGTGYRLRLRQCPFRETARDHQDVVCSLHLGLIQGALTTIRAPLAAGHLEPFAMPGLCIAHLTTHSEPDAISPSADMASRAAPVNPRALDGQ